MTSGIAANVQGSAVSGDALCPDGCQCGGDRECPPALRPVEVPGVEAARGVSSGGLDIADLEELQQVIDIESGGMAAVLAEADGISPGEMRCGSLAEDERARLDREAQDLFGKRQAADRREAEEEFAASQRSSWGCAGRGFGGESMKTSVIPPSVAAAMDVAPAESELEELSEAQRSARLEQLRTQAADIRAMHQAAERSAELARRRGGLANANEPEIGEGRYMGCDSMEAVGGAVICGALVLAAVVWVVAWSVSVDLRTIITVAVVSIAAWTFGLAGRIWSEGRRTERTPAAGKAGR